MSTGFRFSTPAALVSTVLMAAPALAPAQGAAAALAQCTAIPNDKERLACFDQAVRPSAAPKEDAAVAPAPHAPGGDASAAVSASTPPAGSGSMFDAAWGFVPGSKPYDVSLYAPNYFLVGRYTNDVNTAPFYPLVGGGLLAPGTELDSTEAAFEISFKFRLWASEDRRWGAWAAYTQQSQWQLYNDTGTASRPFRETNYMPELILAYKPGLQWGDVKWNLVTLAFNHQSNGRSDTISRSWNRLIAGVGFEQDRFALLGRLWWRIPESSTSDDNPTITDYYGWGDLSAIYKWDDKSSLSATVRGNPSTGKGAAQVTWTSRPVLGPLRGYVKLFSGYGETLIDYNWNQTTIGVGVTLNDWL